MWNAQYVVIIWGIRVSSCSLSLDSTCHVKGWDPLMHYKKEIVVTTLLFNLYSFNNKLQFLKWVQMLCHSGEWG